jgi:hypothetical protein
MRTALYDAAQVLLPRTQKWSWLWPICQVVTKWGRRQIALKVRTILLGGLGIPE